MSHQWPGKLLTLDERNAFVFHVRSALFAFLKFHFKWKPVILVESFGSDIKEPVFYVGVRV